MKRMGWIALVGSGLAVGLFVGKVVRPLPEDALSAAFVPRPPVVVPPAAVASRGLSTAPLVVTVFSDFECPNGALGAKHLAELADGADDVRLSFKNMPADSHPHGQLAARAALAADNQGRFWAYHDALFADQSHLERPALVTRAQRLGLDVARFERDLDAPETQQRLGADMKDGQSLEVEGTPTVFVNGRRVSGPLHVAGLRKLLAEMRHAPPAPTTNVVTSH